MYRLPCILCIFLLFITCGCGIQNPVSTAPDMAEAVPGSAYDVPVESDNDLSEPVFDEPVVSAKVIECDYRWHYGGKDWSFHLDIPFDLYELYVGRERVSRLSSYVKDTGQHKHISMIADKFTDVAASESYSLYQTVEFVLAFVQSIEYATDMTSKGTPGYPRYPIETLVDGVADCKDSSILLAALLREMNIGVALIILSDHMAVGVSGKDLPGAYYEYKGVHYYYVETTGKGWGIGQVPQRYRSEAVQLILL